MYGVKEAIHFLYGIRNQYCLKVIAIFQTTANTGSDSVNILQDRGVFDTCHIGAY